MQQTPSPRTRARNQFFFALCLLGVALAGYLLTRSVGQPAPAPETASSTQATTSQPATGTVPDMATPQRPASASRTIEGEYVCLPHRDTDGPQTMECALGLKGDDGSYYAVSASGATAESAGATTPTGSRVRLTGNVVPVEALSSTQWQKYAIAGVIDVETFTRL